jgi:hypothetical protein
LTHVVPAAQARPQPPQLALSKPGLMQIPAQSISPVPQPPPPGVVHWPSRQVVPASQTMSQPPQLNSSEKLTQISWQR